MSADQPGKDHAIEKACLMMRSSGKAGSSLKYARTVKKSHDTAWPRTKPDQEIHGADFA
jgi:hypothetical protein